MRTLVSPTHLRSGRGKADHIEERAAADRDDVRMAVHVEAIDLGMNFGDVEIRIFGAFAAFDDDRRADEMEFGTSSEIFFDAADEERLGLRKRFVDDNDGFMARAVGGIAHNVAEQ